jgi:hypothetical protein
MLAKLPRAPLSGSAWRDPPHTARLGERRIRSISAGAAAAGSVLRAVPLGLRADGHFAGQGTAPTSAIQINGRAVSLEGGITAMLSTVHYMVISVPLRSLCFAGCGFAHGQPKRVRVPNGAPV